MEEQDPAHSMAPDAINPEDPYSSSMKYGHEALEKMNHAVGQSNQLLSQARDMISKMMDMKPWAQITKPGKDAEKAGQQTQEMAKLARPFIYTQVNSTNQACQTLHLHPG